MTDPTGDGRPPDGLKPSSESEDAVDPLGELAEVEESTPDSGVDPAPSEPDVPPAQPDPLEAAQTEIHAIRKKLHAREAQLQKVTEAYRNIKKESDRLRNRIEHTQKKRFERSKGDFIGRFVEVLDNLDRAIEAIENNFDSDSVLQGIILVRSRLVQLLREEGLEKIFVDGQPFDPLHSEAAGIQPVEEEVLDNKVLRELQRGYMLKGSLLRPARVIVGRYGVPSTETGPESENTDLALRNASRSRSEDDSRDPEHD